MVKKERFIKYHIFAFFSAKVCFGVSIHYKHKDGVSMRYKIGIYREGDSIVMSGSDSSRFKSIRDFSYYTFNMPCGWNPDRKMAEIPLYYDDQDITDIMTSEDFALIPDSLKTLLDSGLLRTSGKNRSDYSVLMSVTEEPSEILHPPEGRTGVLLYKGDPIIVKVLGKEFVIEIKGVGAPDGNNSCEIPMRRRGYFGVSKSRYGSITKDQALREFRNLEIQRNNTKNFCSGDSVRAIALFAYKDKYQFSGKGSDECGYLLRLTPGNIRASYACNSGFPHISRREDLIAESLGKEYADLAGLEDVLLHSTIHPENILFTGSGFVLTDFADSRKLEELSDPYGFLSSVLCKIREVPGFDEDHQDKFYRQISDGLGLEWDPYSGYDAFIDALWSRHIAPKLYEKKEKRLEYAQRNIATARDILDLHKEDDLPIDDFFISIAETHLKKEIKMLENIGSGSASESRHIAEQRIAYLTSQISDPYEINMEFKRDPHTFYNLFLLPYMKR